MEFTETTAENNQPVATRQSQETISSNEHRAIAILGPSTLLNRQIGGNIFKCAMYSESRKLFQRLQTKVFLELSVLQQGSDTIFSGLKQLADKIWGFVLYNHSQTRYAQCEVSQAFLYSVYQSSQPLFQELMESLSTASRRTPATCFVQKGI
jgi:hypothetical protein